MSVVHGTQGTGNDEWYTPLKLLDDVRAVLGTIELDPASSTIAQQLVRAERYFTIRDDALTKPWAARTIFLNPPYSRAKIRPFVERLCHEVEAGNIKAAILLTDSRTDTYWWQRAAKASESLCFTRGRVQFLRPDGSRGKSPIRGQTIFYYGQDYDAFARVFCPPRYGRPRRRKREAA